jgi:ubiquinone/menaquinone biosynthesis C-methylase UbiE
MNTNERVSLMIQRDVFESNEYVGHFKPDEPHNPFRQIYAEKQAQILARVQATVAPGGNVLDLGGGMGRMAVPLAEKYHVTLCDLSPEMLRLAETTAQEREVPADHLTTCQLNAAEPLPFATGRFDAALSIDLLVHLPDPVSALRELRRVLRPQGTLLVDISNSSPWWLLRYPRYVGRRPERWVRTWRDGGVLPEWRSIVRHYTREQFHHMLSDAGFAVDQEWSYGPKWCPKWFLADCHVHRDK